MALRGQLTSPDGYGGSTPHTPGVDFARGPCDALAVLATGDATVVLLDGSSLAFSGLAVGVLPLRATRVQSATATIAPLYW